MVKRYASWIHGTSIRAEHEGYFISKAHAGFGSIFHSHNAPGGGEWFHFAIPTPVITDGQRVSLKKFFILYKTELTAKITAIHVYDGGKKIPDIILDQLALTGDHSTGLDNSNTWTVSKDIQMLFGLGLSINVDFGPAIADGVPGIWFVSAGADFETP